MTEPDAASNGFQGKEKSNNPELFARLGKEIAKRWRDISPESLQRIKKMAEDDMERYCREMSDYQLKRARMRRSEDDAQPLAEILSASTSPLG